MVGRAHREAWDAFVAAVERWGTVTHAPDGLTVDDGGLLVSLVISPEQVTAAVEATRGVMHRDNTDAVLVDGVPLTLLDGLDDVFGPMRPLPVRAGLVGWDFVVRSDEP
jgi:hypothetical protein